MLPQTRRFVPQDLLTHNTARNVLICRLCGYGINQGIAAINSHYTAHHKHITSTERGMLKTEFGGLATLSASALDAGASKEDRETAWEAQDLGYCEDLGRPVKGYRCTVEDSCRHCATTIDSIKAHCGKKHKHHTGSYRQVQVQALFFQRFFEVNPPATPPPVAGGEGDAALKAAYEEALRVHAQELTRAVAQDERQPNMFERRMGWTALLEGRDLARLVQATTTEELIGDTPGLVSMPAVHRLTLEVFAECHNVLMELDRDGKSVILRYLYSVNDRVSETLLNPVGNVEPYQSVWAGFLVFCCRAFRWTPEERRAQNLILPPRLEEGLQVVWCGLEHYQTNPTAENKAAVMEQIFSFLTAVLGQRTGARVEENPLIYFLAVQAWHKVEKRWLTPREYSGILSHVVYGLRAIAARDLQRQRATSQRDTDADFEFIKEYCRVRLLSGCGAVFDEVFNRRSYTMALGINTFGTPRVEWSRLHDSLSYQGHRIQMVDVKRMMSGLIDSAEEWICSLMGVERDYLLRYDPAELRENMMLATAGMSIVDINPSLQEGCERMQARGPECEAYWSNVGAKGRADREIGMTATPLTHP